MFRKHLVSLMFIWCLCLLACFWFLQSSSIEATFAYQRLMSLRDQAEEEQKVEKEPTQQIRRFVTKQIFYKKDCQRLQSRIASEESELVYDRHSSKGELVEHFKGIICTMQEKFIDAAKDRIDQEPATKQYIRSLNARHAIYSYKKGELNAEDVEVIHYLLVGHQWPETLHNSPPLLKGKAQKVHVFLFKAPFLKAYDFQATLYDWGQGG